MLWSVSGPTSQNFGSRVARGWTPTPPRSARSPWRAVKWHSGELLVRFEGVSDRDAAAELRGTWLTVDSATIAPPADPDEFRDADLVGLSVRTADGTHVGTVDDVLHSGQDVLVIKSPDGREFMVPFVKPLVPEVDVKSGFLAINPPEGLLNLEEA